MPLIRYPGSKAKLVQRIVGQFPAQMQMPLWMDAGAWEYREPFFGSGAIGFEILKLLPTRCTAWINDVDYWLVCMWKAVKDVPAELCEKINRFEPSAEKFYEFKAQDGDKNVEPVEAGFRKLALHLMSYSGLGSMAGGPLGGRDQENAEYPCDCRWNAEYRQAEIWELHKILRQHRVKITAKDFTQVIDDSPDAFYYADPPYVDKGPDLYKYSFDTADHGRLAEALKSCPGRWVVSYDDHSLVRELYAGHRIVPVDVCYTIASENESRRKNHEILICSDRENGVKAMRRTDTALA